MKKQIRYDTYNRDELITLISQKNKQIDSQRSMLNQLRTRRKQMQVKVAEGRQVSKENKSLKVEIGHLNQRIAEVIPKARNNEWTKDLMPVLIAMLLGYYKLKKNANMPVTTMLILIVGYQSEYFCRSEIEAVFQKWGRTPDWLWRKKFREYCERGFFHSFKVKHKSYYYMSFMARHYFEYLFQYMLECNDGLYPVKMRRTAGTLGWENHFFEAVEKKQFI